MNFLFLLVAFVFWIAGFLYIRQITSIERRWYQWVVGIGIVVCGFPFFYGALFG